MESILQCPKCLKAAGDGVTGEQDFTLRMDPESLLWGCQNNHVFTPEEATDLMTTLADEKLAALDPEVPPPGRMKKAKTSQARDTKEASKQASVTPKEAPVQVPAGGNDLAVASEEPQELNRDHEAFKDYTPSPGSELAFVLLPDGDALVTVRIREQYSSSAIALADEAKQTLTEWTQERVDFWMENEFALVRSV